MTETILSATCLIMVSAFRNAFVKFCATLLCVGVWGLLMCIVWSILAPQFLYYCSDDALRAFPPFIHPAADPAAWLVFVCWGAWLATTSVGTWKILRFIGRSKIVLTSEGW